MSLNLKAKIDYLFEPLDLEQKKKLVKSAESRIRKDDRNGQWLYDYLQQQVKK